MKIINAAKFKEQCLSLLENSDPEGIIITKHGRAVAKLVPVQENCADLIGLLKDKIKIKSKDLLSTKAKWNAES